MVEFKFCGLKEREFVFIRCFGLMDSVCCFVLLIKIIERIEM